MVLIRCMLFEVYTRIIDKIYIEMEELIEKIAEILEVDELDLKKKFNDYDEWDSLAGLSLIAMLDSDYNMTMKTKEIMAFESIEEFCKAVIK